LDVDGVLDVGGIAAAHHEDAGGPLVGRRQLTPRDSLHVRGLVHALQCLISHAVRHDQCMGYQAAVDTLAQSRILRHRESMAGRERENK
jgi:hypothetical protein